MTINFTLDERVREDIEPIDYIFSVSFSTCISCRVNKITIRHLL